MAKSSNEYTSCADMPFINFIKIATTGDFKWLGRCENADELWSKIHSEYCELSGNTGSLRGLELAKQISFLTTKINITNQIVSYLSTRGRVEELVNELKKMGYRLPYNDLEVDLQRTIGLSKTDHIKLQHAKDQYDKLSNNNVEKPGEFAWYETLAALAKHRGVMVINPSLITVFEYCAMQNEFTQYCQSMRSTQR